MLTVYNSVILLSTVIYCFALVDCRDIFFYLKTVELRNACISLSGKELEKGDVAFKLNLFPFLPIIIRFWEADDEFPASLQILADRNTLDYMHYETLMFALTHLFSRLKEEMRIEKG